MGMVQSFLFETASGCVKRPAQVHGPLGASGECIKRGFLGLTVVRALKGHSHVPNDRESGRRAWGYRRLQGCRPTVVPIAEAKEAWLLSREV